MEKLRYSCRILRVEFIRIINNPGRISGILSKRKVRTFLQTLESRLRFKSQWAYDQTYGRRIYRTYEDYIAHQKKGIESTSCEPHDYDARYREVLRERLTKLNLLRHGGVVLCLGARMGTEVKSFLDLGCFAIGIDLNPGENNRYVVQGDFHDIQFPSSSVDAIFTNSLDHVFDIEKVLNEVKRVLKPEGLLIIEAVGGTGEGRLPCYFESFSWATIDNLESLLKNSGFKLVKQYAFTYPWIGKQLCFNCPP